MNVVSKTHEKSMNRAYESPAVSVVLFQPEGVLCSSGLTEKFNEEDYSNGSFWN